jgi:hypothetical protein
MSPALTALTTFIAADPASEPDVVTALGVLGVMAVFLGLAAGVLWLVLRRGSEGDDPGSDGDGPGSGRGRPRRPPPRPPVNWQEFERQFAEHLASLGERDGVGRP